MKNVTIKHVEKYDFDIWLALWKHYQQFYRVNIDDYVVSKSWERFLDTDEPMNAALAFVDGKALGLVHWLYHRSSWSVGNYCYLQDLFVSDNARSNGVGRALIEHVYTAAKINEASRVYWLTHETNHTAMRLYDQMADKPGFVQYRKIF
ncbi:GNAT family N-acetyltransferase [Xanthomonas euvesicatoria]|uniref:GNAT family N-acetyltransferase n=1 Tax=Xanthomonas euvesicatoria TaxID=456327 RepID=UPI001C462AB4|nr:GNAT family N-acetyltransferase [Xanthomonas euvesicatoria]MBV6885461.1 GNAT family N-acetyltransferase [Xanthomonas campestris pv. euphorbiae]